MDRKRIEGLPIWLLTPKEEKEVFENWRINAWKLCDDQVKAFSECEQLAGYGVWFKCRKHSKAMRDCIFDKQQQKYVDAERDEFIKKKIEFRKALKLKEEEAKAAMNAPNKKV